MLRCLTCHVPRRLFPPRRRLTNPIQHLTGPRDDEPSRMPLPVGWIDRGRIEVSEIDPLAALAGNAGGERDANARDLEAARGVEGAQSPHVRRVRQDASRIVLE